MKSKRLRAGELSIFCAALLAGCSEPEQVPAGGVDTTVSEEVRALTREQIRQSAEAMSPAVAESLGIVDSTIHIESPMPPESVPLPSLPESVSSQ